MFSKILVLISALVLITACSSTGTTSGDADANSAVQQYKTDSKDLPTFEPIAGKKGVRAGDRVFFALDSAVISSAEQATLIRQVKWLKKNPTVKVTVEGHCDERGTREYNLALGDRRASAVKNYLVSSGVESSRIAAISYGKERPAVLGSNQDSWAQNRRAVTVLNQ